MKEKSVLLVHQTNYKFERPIFISPHLIRLEPGPNCRTEIKNYQLKVLPTGFHISKQLDVYSNHISRLVFTEKIDQLSIEVSCQAIIRHSNPLDFFVDFEYNSYPFEYLEHHKADLFQFLIVDKEWGGSLQAQFQSLETSTVSLIIELNKRVFELLKYHTRMEAGTQQPLETLEKGSGSCRDFAWLLVNIYRSKGIASRFVSGYLIDLHATKPQKDALVLHAWVEVYIPGAGWIGLDPTSGLIVGQHYIPLCATAHFKDAAPIEGKTEKADVELSYSSVVKRL